MLMNTDHFKSSIITPNAILNMIRLTQKDPLQYEMLWKTSPPNHWYSDSNNILKIFKMENCNKQRPS